MVPPVELFARAWGAPEFPPLVILHGLLGASRNWQKAAEALAERGPYRVWALDLRNHGQSPHAAPMTMDAMVADVRAWLDAQGLDAVHLLGHSMGGCVAMRLATQHPERVTQLTVVDIGPGPIDDRHSATLRAMAALDLPFLSTRQAVDEALAEAVPEWAFRQFLLTNLTRDPATRQWRWLVNLPVLIAALPTLFAEGLPEGAVYAGPTRFIGGAQSTYFDAPASAPLIRRHFPQATTAVVPQSGHNVHFDNLSGFLAAMEAVRA